MPDAAVLRDSENQPFVYAELSPNQFGMRSVTLGDSQKGPTQITSGLKPGDRVIGDGQPVPAVREFTAALGQASHGAKSTI